MTTPRRYHDDQVRAIFAAVASRESTDLPAASDPHQLTLSEMQEIGSEVGLDPAEIARAAATLDAQALERRPRTSFGMPIEVVRVVPLPRAPTDAEWEQIVAELRATFGSRGRISSQGNLREWTIGNLYACVEPGGTGYHLRLGTVKGGARELNGLGAASLLGATVLVVTGGAGIAVVPWVFAAYGTIAFGLNALRLPRWAGERRQQMEVIAARLRSIMQSELPAGEPKS